MMVELLMQCSAWILAGSVVLGACSASTVPADFGQPCSAEDVALAQRRPAWQEMLGGERFIVSSSCQSGQCYIPTRFSYEECVARLESRVTSGCDLTRVIGGPRHHCSASCESNPCPEGYICDQQKCRRRVWDRTQCVVADQLGPTVLTGCFEADGTVRRIMPADGGVSDSGVSDGG